MCSSDLLDAHILGAGRCRFIYAAVQNDAKKAALEALGVTVIYMPGESSASTGSSGSTATSASSESAKVDLPAMLRDLAAREVNELHIEAGHKLNGSFIREGLIDEFVLYIAPKLMGAGQGIASFGPLQSLSDAVQLQFMSTEMLGNDLRIRARVAGRDQF